MIPSAIPTIESLWAQYLSQLSSEEKLKLLGQIRELSKAINIQVCFNHNFLKNGIFSMPLTAVNRRPTYNGTPKWLRQQPDSYPIYSGKESKNTYSSAKNTTVRRNQRLVEISPVNPAF